MDTQFHHVSVLLTEAVEGLAVRPGGSYADGTTGGGGHSEAILERLGGSGKLYCFDQDRDALEHARKRLSPYGSSVRFFHRNFSEMADVLREEGLQGLDGIVLDLGVSSYQLDTPERGFSYQHDAPLDMRMDQDGAMTAADIVNNYSQEELARVIREFGEERFAASIARTIVRARERKPVLSTGELSELVKEAIPARYRRTGGHPAKRTFQALRIELNHELEVLRDSLDGMIGILNPGGRLCVITFHSLEDRIVKNCFSKNENPCTCPPSFPVCVCGKKRTGHMLSRKPILPSEEEMEGNPRAKSAKLRIFVKD